MKFEPTPLNGAYVIRLDPYEDERGSFARAFSQDEFLAQGLELPIAQASISRNPRRGTLRGLHYRVAEDDEAKLVRCTAGAVFDVIVDLRAASQTRGRSFTVELSAAEQIAIFVPRGFAHAFLTLVDDTDLFYMMSRPHDPRAERGIRWDDPKLAIQWPFPPTLISARDRSLPEWSAS